MEVCNFTNGLTRALTSLEGDIADVIRLIHINQEFIDKFSIGKAGQKIASALKPALH